MAALLQTNLVAVLEGVSYGLGGGVDPDLLILESMGLDALGQRCSAEPKDAQTRVAQRGAAIATI